MENGDMGDEFKYCEYCTDECTEEGFLPFGGVCRKCAYTCREHLGYFLDE